MTFRLTSTAYGADAAAQPLHAMRIARRTPGPHDVQIDIAYCGVCHSDIHQVRSEWAGTLYPCVPGHEIVGQVSTLGAQVNDACGRMLKGDVKYRFVIDRASLAMA